MSGRSLDFEENRQSPRGARSRLSELRHQVRLRDARIKNLEALLDRILICLNAYGSGEGAYPTAMVAKSIVHEICVCRLLEADANAPEA